MSRVNIMKKLKERGSSGIEAEMESAAEDEALAQVVADEQKAISDIEAMMKADKELDARLAGVEDSQAVEEHADDVELTSHIEIEEYNDDEKSNNNDIEVSSKDEMTLEGILTRAASVVIEQIDDDKPNAKNESTTPETDIDFQKENDAKPKVDPFEEVAKALKQSKDINYGEVDNKYLKLAQSVLSSSTVTVKALKLDDDRVVNYVSDNNFKWVDDGKKVNLFNEDLLDKENPDTFCVNETVLVALAIAKEKGWRSVKFTAASEELAERIESAAKEYGFKKISVHVAEKPALNAHEQKKVEASKELPEDSKKEISRELDSELTSRMSM